MEKSLNGKRIAVLVHHGFELVELIEPKRAIEQAGGRVEIVSPVKGKKVRGWNHSDWGEELDVDLLLDDAHPEQFDALLLPGGVMNPDKLRMNERAVAFVKAFADAGKPIAAICHAAWTLIEAGAVRGREMTSYPSLKTDLENAGAEWVDEPVVIDMELVTSRKPDDLPMFIEKMIEVFAEPERVEHERAA